MSNENYNEINLTAHIIRVILKNLNCLPAENINTLKWTEELLFNQ